MVEVLSPISQMRKLSFCSTSTHLIKIHQLPLSGGPPFPICAGAGEKAVVKVFHVDSFILKLFCVFFLLTLGFMCSCVWGAVGSVKVGEVTVQVSAGSPFGFKKMQWLSLQRILGFYPLTAKYYSAQKTFSKFIPAVLNLAIWKYIKETESLSLIFLHGFPPAMGRFGSSPSPVISPVDRRGEWAAQTWRSIPGATEFLAEVDWAPGSQPKVWSPF